MSTLRDSTDAANARSTATILPAGRRDFNEVVREFETAAASLGTAHPSLAELSDLCRQAAAFTAELFPGGMEIRVKNDPEIPDDLYFVFAVRATGSVDDIVARNDQWHRCVARTEGKWHGLFRLAIDAH